MAYGLRRWRPHSALPHAGASTVHAASIIDEWASVKAPPPPPVKAGDGRSQDHGAGDGRFRASRSAAATRAAWPRCRSPRRCSRRRAPPRCWWSTPAFPKCRSRPYVAEALLQAGDAPFVQSFTDKFLNTDLEKILKDHGITTLLMTAYRPTAPSSKHQRGRAWASRSRSCSMRPARRLREQFVAWSTVIRHSLTNYADLIAPPMTDSSRRRSVSASILTKTAQTRSKRTTRARISLRAASSAASFAPATATRLRPAILA